jgi:hypothetical protein
VVLAEHTHGARLGSFLALLLDKRHWGSDGQRIERIVEDARSIENP